MFLNIITAWKLGPCRGIEPKRNHMDPFCLEPMNFEGLCEIPLSGRRQGASSGSYSRSPYWKEAKGRCGDLDLALFREIEIVQCYEPGMRF